jgi:hypothetical protein
MEQNFYWEGWDKEYRNYYRFLLGVIGLLILSYIGLLFLGNDASIDWAVKGSLSTLDMPLAGYDLPSGILDFNTQLFLVDQKFMGGQMELIPAVSYLYFGVFAFGLIICLTMVSYLGKFWYTVSMGLFMIIIIGLRFELLGLFGMYDQTATIGIFLIYTISSYYFNSFRAEAEIRWRFLTFTGITILLGVLIFFFSGVVKPFLYLATYSFIPAVVISIIFIFLVSHEIIYGILRITTESTSSLNLNNTKHFVILSVVYMLNLALVRMRNTGYIDWDIFYFNALFILLISSIIGFWGLKSREKLYGKLLPFYPYTAFLYCGLLLCCFSFIGYHLYQQNDVAIEVMEDTIIYGHLGYGSMFFLYIIINFVNYLMKNLPVYKIAYKEDKFPYWTARLAGIIVVAALYFSAGSVAQYQSIAAFYNGMGDLYQQTDRAIPAQAMYLESSRYGRNNHKANYNLGFMSEDEIKRISSFRNASIKQPSEFAFINLGLEYEKSNQFFEALFAYQDGLQKFPSSAPLKNNLALLFNKTDVIDSTLFYLSDLSSAGFKKEVVLSNLLSVCADKGLTYNSLVSKEDIDNSDRFDINANLVANLAKYGYDSISTPIITSESSRLNLFSYAYINNLAISSYNRPNEEVLSMLNVFLSNEENSDFNERLLFLKALNMYSLGKVGGAFEILSNLIHNSNIPEYYRALAGIWSLEQGSPKLAVNFLDVDSDKRDRLGNYYLALAYGALGEDEIVNRQLELMKLGGDSLFTYSFLKEALTSELKNKNVLSRQAAVVATKLQRANEIGDQSGELASALYRTLGLDNPFSEEAVLASVAYFNKQKEQQSEAYDILLKAIDINPYSETLIKSYIEQCFLMSYFSYAESGLMKLLDVATMDEFKEYEAEFEDKRRALEFELDSSWEE